MKDSLIENINKILKTQTSINIYNNYFKDQLNTKTIKISIKDINIVLFIKFEEENIILSSEENKVDVEISGKLSSFIFYSTFSGSDLFSSKINISGDVETANSLNNLLKESDILRSIIIEIVGQKAASSIFSILDPIKEKINESSENKRNSLADFLKYDTDLVPNKEEINNYIDEVDDIKSRTEKLSNKIK